MRLIKDKHYYRGMSNSGLLEEMKRGLDVQWQDMAIVLEERLRAEEEGRWDDTCPTCGE